jgi:hypothetical protein
MQSRRGRGGRPRDGSGPGCGQRSSSGRAAGGGKGQSSLGGRTTTRALVAVGAYVVQDLRDAEGLTRPLLRRAALRLAMSPSEPVRRVGGAYLRLDPPAPEELPVRRDVIDVRPPAAGTRSLPSPGAGTDPAGGPKEPPL